MDLVVFLSPVLDDDSGLGQRQEPFQSGLLGHRMAMSGFFWVLKLLFTANNESVENQPIGEWQWLTQPLIGYFDQIRASWEHPREIPVTVPMDRDRH